jgi:hypothetical protein
MKKYHVLETSVVNRSTKDDSVLEECSYILKICETRAEAEEYMATIDLPEVGDLYKEIMEVEDDD